MINHDKSLHVITIHGGNLWKSPLPVGLTSSKGQPGFTFLKGSISNQMWQGVTDRFPMVPRASAFLRTSFWIFSSSNTRCSLGRKKYPTCLLLRNGCELGFSTGDPMVPQNKLMADDRFPHGTGHFGQPLSSQSRSRISDQRRNHRDGFIQQPQEFTTAPDVGQKWGTNDEPSNQSLDYCDLASSTRTSNTFTWCSVSIIGGVWLMACVSLCSRLWWPYSIEKIGWWCHAIQNYRSSSNHHLHHHSRYKRIRMVNILNTPSRKNHEASGQKMTKVAGHGWGAWTALHVRPPANTRCGYRRHRPGTIVPLVPARFDEGEVMTTIGAHGTVDNDSKEVILHLHEHHHWLGEKKKLGRPCCSHPQYDHIWPYK